MTTTMMIPTMPIGLPHQDQNDNHDDDDEQDHVVPHARWASSPLTQFSENPWPATNDALPRSQMSDA